MKLSELEHRIPVNLYKALQGRIENLMPAQEKALKAGILEGKNVLVCTPTSSGKTLVAELAAMSAILSKKGKAVYIVPLKALANEKFKEFKEKYGSFARIALSIGDLDSADNFLADYDMIIATAEKLDSLIRHRALWLKQVSVVVVDEIHMLNDPSRGPTLEILITLLRELIRNVQLVALSATIGNPEELAAWLDARLVVDEWRPVKLHKGIYLDGEVEFE